MDDVEAIAVAVLCLYFVMVSFGCDHWDFSFDMYVAKIYTCTAVKCVT